MVILDYFCLIDGKPEYRDENNEFWGKIYKECNIMINLYNSLYQTGELKQISEYLLEYDVPDKPNIKALAFVIDSDKFTEEFLTRMDKEHPGHLLREINKFRPCEYCGCIGLNDFCIPSYRDTYGTVGRSFEHPFVTGFYPKDCDDFWTIWHEKSAVEAGIEVIKRAYRLSDVKPMTSEEYRKVCDEFYLKEAK